MKTKEELLILGSPMDELCRKKLLDEKIKELEKSSDVVDKLDAYIGTLIRQKLNHGTGTCKPPGGS